jgi:hypothetical protein
MYENSIMKPTKNFEKWWEQVKKRNKGSEFDQNVLYEHCKYQKETLL